MMFYTCNEDIKPSAAFSCRHIKYKIHALECTETRLFYFKNSKISQPPTPDPMHPPHRHLRHIDLGAFGAHWPVPAVSHLSHLYSIWHLHPSCIPAVPSAFQQILQDRPTDHSPELTFLCTWYYQDLSSTPLVYPISVIALHPLTLHAPKVRRHCTPHHPHASPMAVNG